MKKLFLHIGPPKTGSTTIQRFLDHNKDILLNYGYLYPQTGMLKKLPAQHNLGFFITERKQANPTFGTWEQLHQEIEKAKVDNIIISSESFGRANKKHINNLSLELKSYDVKIIVYLRRQDLRIESQYTQSVKFGWYLSNIVSFIEQRKITLDYYKLLQPWKKVFGFKNIIVRPLEKTQIPDVCQDILSILGITNHDDFRQIDSKNIRPGRKALEILKLTNNIYGIFPKKERQKYIRRIDKYLSNALSEDKSKYRLLSYSDSVKILEEYEESNQAVAREYFGRKDGVLFYEKLEKYENDDFTIERLSKEDLLCLIQAFQ